MITILLGVGLIILAYYYITRQEFQGLPPGPWGIPILGNLPFLDSRFPEHSFINIGKKYGSIFSLKMGVRDAVVINDYFALKEVLSKPESTGRPNLLAFRLFSKKDKLEGMAFNWGPIWHEYRRFTLKTLKDLGAGKDVMMEGIIEEVEALVNRIKLEKGKAFRLDKLLPFYVLNVVWKMVTGRRVREDEEEIAKIIKVVEQNMKDMPFLGLISCLPDSIINLLPREVYSYSNIKSTVDFMTTFMADMLKKREESIYDDEVLYLADAIIKKKREEGPNSPFHDEENLTLMLGDLFIAALDTTTSTIMFAIVYLLNYPEVEKKLRKEIENVVGYERRPTNKDREKMPYTEAFLHELQRKADIAPLAIYHMAVEDIKVHEYIIPKGHMIIGNLHAIHSDPKLWDSPEKFKPERFLDESGQCQKTIEGLLPFSTGKRRCPGEIVAVHELFYFITILLQEFTFSTPSSKPPSLEKLSGLVTRPKPFELMCSLIEHK